ncbi:hypothetical protein HPB50_009956 [Hyalomma asiaticum]|uniref:Uncharacterized protein n=1 Tax=Hyalomma asiaticum TaxID=266040 RepID=A0ACB7RK71_HYAAI|nr:hypothetical protein HPB50_009956 [Hyalomma asiaticum]
MDGHDDRLTGLSADLEAATRSTNTTPTTHHIDSHLLHLRDSGIGLTKSSKWQRLNRRLQVQIVRITRETREYAQIPTKNNRR